MYTHILAALDGSPRAAQVLHQAAELAARSGAALHLCRAVHLPLGIPADAYTLSGEQLTARLLADGVHELATLVGQLNPHITPIRWGERVCRFGVPAQVLVDVAAELHADLIVLGSHGYNVIDRLLGTTAARIVHHAPCSVLVVRPTAAPAA